MNLEQALAEIQRLTGVNRRNKEAFVGLRATANRWRDRALDAEARLEESRKSPQDRNMDAVLKSFEGLFDSPRKKRP